MSRWHDHSREGIAHWASLSTAERLADLLHDLVKIHSALAGLVTFEILPAEFDRIDVRAGLKVIHTICEEWRKRLPPPVELPGRDPELEDVLATIETRIAAMQSLVGPDWDEAYEDIERFAEPYAIAFCAEIRRLDRILGNPGEDL
jgi:hypothetical protein